MQLDMGSLGPHWWSTPANPSHWKTVNEVVYNPQRRRISMNSKFAFLTVVNQLTCKCCPVFGMRLSFWSAAESSVGLTQKTDEWESKLRDFFLCSTNIITVHSLLF